MLDEQRFARAMAVFHAAAKLPRGAWADYVAQAAPDDAEVRSEVLAMLVTRRDTEHDTFLDTAREVVAAAARLADEAAPEPTRIGAYRVVQRVGDGGMGTVYRAEQETPVQRIVALKVLKRGMDTAALLGRFAAERQALARMDSHHIAKVFDAGATADGRPFFAMEFVDGLPITHYCDTYRVGIEDRIRLLQQVCEGAQHAHQRGVIHRDLKPGNVLVTVASGQPIAKIIDFGIARAIGGAAAGEHTAHGMVVGTRDYMSPEQAAGGAGDTRSDVWALGVLLFELLAGQLPFARQPGDEAMRPSATAIALPTGQRTDLAARRRLEPKAWARRLRGDLDAIAQRALDVDPDRRYGSPMELHADLGRYLRREVVTARAPGALHRLRRLVQRNRTAAAVAAIAGIVVAVSIGVLWRQGQDIARERGRRLGGLVAQAEAAVGALEQVQASGAWRLRSLRDAATAAVHAATAARDAAVEADVPAATAAADALLAQAASWQADVASLEALDEALLEVGFGSTAARSQRRVRQLGAALAAYGVDVLGGELDPAARAAAVARIDASRLRTNLLFAVALLRAAARAAGQAPVVANCVQLLTALGSPQQRAVYAHDYGDDPTAAKAAMVALEPEVMEPLEAVGLAMAMDTIGMDDIADRMLARLELAAPGSFELRDGQAARAFGRLARSAGEQLPQRLREPQTFRWLESMAKAAIAAGPERRGGWFHWVRLLTIAQDPTAVAVAERAVAMFPEDASLLYLSAMALRDADHTDASLARLREVVAVEPQDAWARYQIALLSDDADEQRAQLATAVANDPYLVEVVLAYARFLMQHEEPATMLQALHPLLGSEPMCPPANELAARAAVRLGRHGLAAGHLAVLRCDGATEFAVPEVQALQRSGDPQRAADRALAAAMASDDPKARTELRKLVVAAELACGRPDPGAALDGWLDGAVPEDLLRPEALAVAARRRGDWGAVARAADAAGDAAGEPSLAMRLEQAATLLAAGVALARTDLHDRGWSLATAALTKLKAEADGDARIAAFLMLAAWQQREPQRSELQATRAAQHGGPAGGIAAVSRWLDACDPQFARLQPRPAGEAAGR